MNIKLTGILAALLLGGCAATTGQQPTTFAQTAVKICQVALPVVDGTQQTMSQLVPPLGEADMQKINKAVSMVTLFCNSPAAATPFNAQAMVNGAFPVLFQIVRNSSMSNDNKNLTILGLGAAETSIKILVPSIALPITQ